MRHIKNDELRRLGKRANFDDLAAAKKELEAIADEKKRNAYIKANYAKWTALKYALWTLGYGKCWYSEVRLQADEGEVEHFRPMNDVWKCAHGGYWWLAFDWRNFRFAHPTVNKSRTDYATEETAGKGCYFPLENEEQRAYRPEDIGNEVSVLLDPTNPSDCRLLWFNSESGLPEPRYEKSENEWRYRRASESIRYYHLDEGTWNADRSDLMKAVEKLCNEIIDLGAVPDADKYDALVERLLGYIHPFAEFSAAALQVIREKGLYELGSKISV